MRVQVSPPPVTVVPVPTPVTVAPPTTHERTLTETLSVPPPPLPVAAAEAPVPKSRYEHVLFKRLGQKDAIIQQQDDEIRRLNALLTTQVQEMRAIQARLAALEGK